jgi:hypothetical protein
VDTQKQHARVEVRPIGQCRSLTRASPASLSRVGIEWATRRAHPLGAPSQAPWRIQLTADLGISIGTRLLARTARQSVSAPPVRSATRSWPPGPVS